MNTTHLNTIAATILASDLDTSKDVLSEHFDAIKDIDCNGTPFALALFHHAITTEHLDVCRTYIPHFAAFTPQQRLSVVTAALQWGVSLELITILLDHDFGLSHNSDTTHENGAGFDLLLSVAQNCAQTHRFDVIEWILRTDDFWHAEYLYFYCHYFCPTLHQHISPPFDPIFLLCGMDPSVRHAFHLSANTCDNIRDYAWDLIATRLQNQDAEPTTKIFDTLCDHIYHNRTVALKDLLNDTGVVEQIEENTDLSYNLVQLALTHNSVMAADLLLTVLSSTGGRMSTNLVRSMLWRNFPLYITAEHVDTPTATKLFPCAVAANLKEIGFLLLDIGVDLSAEVDWADIQREQEFYPNTNAQNARGFEAHEMWHDRFNEWVSEYEKMVLEINTQNPHRPSSLRKI